MYRHVLLQGEVGLVVVVGQGGNLGGQPLDLLLLGQHLLGLHGVGVPRLLQLSGGLGSQLQEHGEPAAGERRHSSSEAVRLSRIVSHHDRDRRSGKLLPVILFSSVGFYHFL